MRRKWREDLNTDTAAIFTFLRPVRARRFSMASDSQPCADLSSSHISTGSAAKAVAATLSEAPLSLRMAAFSAGRSRSEAEGKRLTKAGSAFSIPATRCRARRLRGWTTSPCRAEKYCSRCTLALSESMACSSNASSKSTRGVLSDLARPSKTFFPAKGVASLLMKDNFCMSSRSMPSESTPPVAKDDASHWPWKKSPSATVPRSSTSC
mmetsp:Transcript_64280/g.115619  ORF Transcript_64280/g.115619 Transcript_64280/m.115619 type:complete len:209 (-) Transcript_64280:77-703(-)